ncbi:MAG TPA: IPT/TIG domain-containing protein [Acidobacteriaceae bacterium]|nr:IPT/TIG domain-containing protein [Acidobacteriaceae bacterium]
MYVGSERPGACRLALPVIFLAGALSLISGCGSIIANAGNLTAISVASGTIRVNQQIQINNRMAVTAVPLTFFVNGIQGGDSEVGTVSSSGVYTAPALVPSPNTVTVTATANGHPDAAPGTLTLAVLNPIPIVASVAPTSPSEGTTTITVQGSEFVYGAQILWNGQPVATTYVSSTEVAAAVTAPTPGTYPLVVSNPNPGAANSGTISVLVGPGQVVLTIEPNNGTDVRVTNSLGLAVDVTGTANTGVTLAVNGIPGGNATVGTAVAGAGGAITYTAPAVVPTPSNVVELTITSVDNPKVSINQNISVLNPIPILTSATPSSFATTGSASVTVTGLKFISGAEVLMNGAPMPTTFKSGTQLTATLSLTQAGNFDIQVLNPSPGPATSADFVASVQGTPPVPIVTPKTHRAFWSRRHLARPTLTSTTSRWKATRRG